MDPSEGTTTNTPAEGSTPADGTTAAAANADSVNTGTPGAGEGQGEAGNNGGESNNDGKEGTDPDKSKEGEEQPQGAPEAYEAFTLPDGYAMEGERLEMAHEFARANNWTQAQAQEGVETYLKFRAAEREHERGLWGAQSEEEFGSNFASISEGAQRALVEAEKLRPGITERLDATSLGNHPDVLWMFNEFGKLSTPKPMLGMGNEATTQNEQTPEQRMYAYADKPNKPKR